MSKNNKKSKRIIHISEFLTSFVVVLLVLQAMDMVRDIRTDSSDYELRYEAIENLQNGQMVYRLYRAGEFWDDVDYNRFSLVDEGGNTDYRYCAVIEDAVRMTFSVIMGAMLLLVIAIAKSAYEGYPFTQDNIRLVKVIAFLQIGLATLPGIVRLIMTMLRFSYYSSTFTIETLYMLGIAYVIGMIAKIFEWGLTLQEDVDSIA